MKGICVRLKAEETSRAKVVEDIVYQLAKRIHPTEGKKLLEGFKERSEFALNVHKLYSREALEEGEAGERHLESYYGGPSKRG